MVLGVAAAVGALVCIGLTFELPLVVTGLVVMGIVSPDALRTRYEWCSAMRSDDGRFNQ